MRDFLALYINGRSIELKGEDVFRTLSGFLREQLGATGTKIVCEEGDCGACTVLVGTAEQGSLVYRPVNSCILQMYQLDCTHVVTVEGISRNGTLSAVQDSMVRHHGAQCGFCTPGFVVALAALFEENDRVDEGEVRAGLTGNLCRCTGYTPIVQAALDADPSSVERMHDLYPQGETLERFDARGADAVHLVHGGREFLSAATLEQAVDFLSRHPGATIVQGATDVGVWRNKRLFAPPAVLSISRIPELTHLAVNDGVLEVGASVTLTALEAFVRGRIPEFAAILERFGSRQIRHVATLAGNIANASPIADSLPFLFVMGAQVEMTGPAGRRLVDITSLYRGYKSLDMAPDELITRVLVPLPAADETLRLYKVSRRRDLDISTVTAAIRMRHGDDRIEEVRVAYGGVGPVVLRLPRTEAWLMGKEMSEAAFAEAGRIAREEVSPISDVRGSREYRLQLVEKLMLRFFHECVGEKVSA